LEPIGDYENECERYLLGEMTEQEQTQLEEQYFEDDVLFERFVAVKDDLVDAYARGQLGPEKRDRFEQHFLATPPRRLKVEQSRRFINAATAVAQSSITSAAPGTRSPKISWWQSISSSMGVPSLVLQGAFAVLLLIALASAWIWIRNLQNRKPEQAKLQDNRPKPDPGLVPSPSPQDTNPVVTVTASPSPPAVNRNPPQQPAPAHVASVTLLPFAPRDGSGGNTLRLAPDTDAVQLNLTFKDDEYRSYSVEVRTVEGEQILQRRGVKAVGAGGEKKLTINVDPARLNRQDFIVTLNGLSGAGMSEALAEYYFRVERTPPR
jgi:hypothetical protein